MQEKLREVVELQEVSPLKQINEVSAKNLISAKKLVLDLIFKALPEQTTLYAALMQIHQELLADVTDDELAFEVVRLIQRKQGSKTDAVLELKMINDGK